MAICRTHFNVGTFVTLYNGPCPTVYSISLRFRPTDENSQKERYNEKRYKFYFYFLFGNFLLKCDKNNERENNFFFKKGRGYRLQPLWFRQYIYIIDIPSRISKGDKSEKGYFSYILHFNLILNINIVGGSKMLWKNISANKPLINLH
jgi:hypothetical protein